MGNANSTLDSTISVANASSHPIFVMVDCDRFYVSQAGIALKDTLAVETAIRSSHIAEVRGFIKILPGKSLPFRSSVAERNAPGYVTIFYADDESDPPNQEVPNIENSLHNDDVFEQKSSLQLQYDHISRTLGSLRIVCTCYPIKANQGAIVGSDKQVRATEKRRIWVDTDGVDWSPPGVDEDIDCEKYV
ncbi:hypothetical protein L596_015354 [Steinernema carpocapsae]|uniref:Uncharacterized protein n=1 Tax=Steinernema carpocapsae TaxID=34508 RepID=A0A4U5NFL3_STECR|nr:hypothetical protein L596_015354 [Steinernema carpocapsae]